MSQSEKSAYFQALKSAGVQFERHYREYSTAELKAAYDKLAESGAAPPLAPTEPEPAPPTAAAAAPAAEPGPELDPEAAHFFGFDVEPDLPTPQVTDPEVLARPAPPQAAQADPNEMAGARLNSQPEDLPIRIDEQGRAWYQEEVLKPPYPKPRGRRVLRYMDPGVQKRTVVSGQYSESFEIPGDPANARPAEVKITLPSYQVGIYKDPRFPFKVITYNGNQGFDLFEVQSYYGGAELVPAEIKRKYVENVLCYDIRTVVRAIESEYRRLQLAGKA